jgi:hypothetical protein
MVTGHFLRIPEIEVDSCHLNPTRLSASAAVSGVVVVVAAAVAAAWNGVEEEDLTQVEEDHLSLGLVEWFWD